MQATLELPDMPLTAEQFAQLPEVDGVRMELWEGNLLMAAAAQMAWHSATARRIEDIFREANREVLREVGVVVAPRHVPVPDVVVFRNPIEDLRKSQFAAELVDCVVEVVSPESIERDTKAKPAKYAAAGIPEFWLVTEDPTDLSEASVEIYRLTPAGGYGLAERTTLTKLEQR